MAGLHQLKRMTKRAYRRVGRGQSSSRGKQSGRGGKGQTARAGHKIRPALRDIIKKLPKRRGYGKNRGRTVNSGRVRRAAVSLSRLENIFGTHTEITSKLLAEHGIVHMKSGRLPWVKLVGNSAVPKAVVFKGISASTAARAAVEKAGGSIS